MKESLLYWKISWTPIISDY